MFSTNEYKGKLGPVFYTGWNKAKVESITTEEARNGSGRVRMVFNLYGEPIDQEGFKPWNKEDGSSYKGQCGRVRTIYFKTDEPKEVEPIMTRIIKPMLIAFGVNQVFDSAVNENTNFTDFVKVLNELLTGPELPYVWMNFNGEEYVRVGKDRPGINLFFKAITNDDSVKDKIPAGTLKRIQAPSAQSVEENGNIY